MSERRFNPLTGDWVLVSPNRTARPWQGALEQAVSSAAVAAYDPQCYLCPGNVRANGESNPHYEGVHVFDNDFPALSLESSARGPREEAGLFIAREERGLCRVVCFSPRHDRGIGEIDAKERRAVVDAWAEQYAQLGARDEIAWVQIFENRGEMMGASNPHPHGQLWAESSIPNEPAKEEAAFLRYRQERGVCLLCSYVARELERGERLVFANDAFAVVVPFWANWPYEALLVSRAHERDLATLDERSRDALAEAIGVLVRAYDALFDVPFPYSMGFHQRPTSGGTHDEWHVHAHYYPPLLRSATVRKFAVGYEMLAQPQRDVTAEEAAARLRACIR